MRSFFVFFVHITHSFREKGKIKRGINITVQRERERERENFIQEGNRAPVTKATHSRYRGEGPPVDPRVSVTNIIISPVRSVGFINKLLICLVSCNQSCMTPHACAHEQMKLYKQISRLIASALDRSTSLPHLIFLLLALPLRFLPLASLSASPSSIMGSLGSQSPIR